MKLIVNAVSNSPWQRLAPILMLLGCDKEELAAANMRRKGESLNCTPSEGEFYLLLQWHPEKVIAQAMRESVEPLEALMVWKAETERQVNFHEINSGRSLLVDIDCFLADPKETLKNFPEELRHVFTGELPQFAVPNLNLDLYLLLAHRAAFQSPEVQVLLERLYSLYSVKYRGEYFIRDHDISQLYREVTSLSRVGKERDTALEVVEQENQLLLTQLRRAENDYDNLYRKVAANNRKLNTISSDNYGAGFRGGYKRLRRSMSKLVNPANPVIWRITAPMRAFTRPVRRAFF